MCHNDLCVENVVVRDGVAVAFIDFDFAAPNDPLIDIAIAARHWVPFRDPDRPPRDLGRHRPGGPFPVPSATSTASMPPPRGRVVEEGKDFLDRALVSMRTRAESGLPLYVAVWEGGYADQNRRSTRLARRPSTDAARQLTGSWLSIQSASTGPLSKLVMRA